jgi:hypothetical protein
MMFGQSKDWREKFVHGTNSSRWLRGLKIGLKVGAYRSVADKAPEISSSLIGVVRAASSRALCSLAHRPPRAILRLSASARGEACVVASRKIARFAAGRQEQPQRIHLRLSRKTS